MIILVNGLTPLQIAGDETLEPEEREHLLREALAQLPNPDRSRRLYAVWCARRALGLVTAPDSRSILACQVAEKFALGMATGDELVYAEISAHSAAWAAAVNAEAEAAARPAYVAAYVAAKSAAFTAASSAAQCASWTAAQATAAALAAKLKGLSYDSAYASERKQQIQYLVGVLMGRARRPRPSVRTRRILI